jgi:hypothetical protein
MKPTWLVIVAAILLPGCSVAAPAGPIVDAPPPVAGAPIPPAKPAAATCDAPDLAWLVGRSRNEIPVPVDPARRRVACTQCMVTEDYRPDRTTIRYDAATGLVTSVTCG